MATLIEAAFKMVACHYAEPFRRYHGIDHPREMLAYAERRGIELSVAQQLAVVFHDIVCLPLAPAGANEDMSALAFRAMALYLDVPAEVVEEAARIIGDTDHRRIPSGPSSEIVLDLDLLRLAEPYDVFLRHSEDVFEEYRSVVPDRDAFMWGRAKFCQGMLRRRTLFYTDQFDGIAAVDNLKRFAREFECPTPG